MHKIVCYNWEVVDSSGMSYFNSGLYYDPNIDSQICKLIQYLQRDKLGDWWVGGQEERVGECGQFGVYDIFFERPT